MTIWARRLLLLALVLPGALALSGCGDGGCGKKKEEVRCGEGTQKVADGSGYKCVPS